MDRTLSGDSEVNYEIDGTKNFGALMTVLCLATCGGWLVNFIFGLNLPPYLKWLNMDKWWRGHIHKICLPPLLG